MARRDYKDTGNRAAGRRGGGLRLLALGILFGLGAAALLAWYLMPRESDFRTVESAPKLKAPAPPPQSKPAEAPANTAEPGMPPTNPSNYTFYDILGGDKTPKPLPPAKEQWWLQVAALKSAADADALRARLTLLNLSATVQAAPGTPPLHRVRVGPFRSQDAAESAQETLVLNKFEARLLKEPIAP